MMTTVVRLMWYGSVRDIIALDIVVSTCHS
jgi:hypothetical protein